MKARDLLEALPDETLVPLGFIRDLLEGSVETPEASPTMLTVKETSERLRMSQGWIYDNQKELGAVKYGRAIRFAAEDVDEYRRRMERER